MEIRDKTALITGAAKRIGRAIALALAREGVNIALTYNTSQRAAIETKEELKKHGIKVTVFQANLCSANRCEDLIQQVLNRFSKLDILVNNASCFLKTDIKELGRDPVRFEKEFDNLARLHIASPLYLGMQLGSLMKKNGWGRIINITDRVVVKGQAYRNWSLYQATKYGLHGVTQVLAVELSPEVTVNSIAPGLVLPPPDFTRDQLLDIRKRIPLKREASPEEIAKDVLHLIRSDSKTGSTILTDGGVSLLTY